jgi:hypothetical protein
MSHTYNAQGGTRFFHDGDFGGTVSVIVPAMPRSVSGAAGSAWEVQVPFADLRELVFAYLRGRQAEFAEQSSDDEFEQGLLGRTKP